MTVARKKKVLSDRYVKNAKSRAKSAEQRAQNAKMEAQIAEIDVQYNEQRAEIEAQLAKIDAQRDAQIAKLHAQTKSSQPVAAASRPSAGSYNADLITQLIAQNTQLQEQIAVLQNASLLQDVSLRDAGNFREQSASVFRPDNTVTERGTPDGMSQGIGFSPQGDGFAPIRKSFAPQTDGFPPQADGLPPTAYRFAPQADGRFEKGSPRITFPVPVITNAFASGPHAITVHWLSVPGADGYSLRFATDPELTQYVSSTVAATLTGLTRTGLEPGTKYYVMIRANAASPDSASNYSVPIEVTTPAESQPGVAGDLYAWWNAMETATAQFTSSIPAWGPVVLSPAERRRLKGSGVRRYGFIDKVSDVSADWPQFWPSSANGLVDFQSAMKERLRELEVLRNLLVWIDMIRRNVGDLLLLAGDDAFKMAGVYYSTVRAAARNHLNGAPQVFKLLQLFWNHRRKATDDVTIAQAEHDAKALLHGNEEGSLTIVNQGRHTTGGKTFIADETRNVKQHNGTKVVERETTG